jgi:hypothetical protein
LQRKTIKSTEDIDLQNQLFAYIVAKHYGVSLTEVYNMGEAMFKQSLIWALAIEDEERKAQKRQEMESSTSNETVTFDYDFLHQEDF